MKVTINDTTFTVRWAHTDRGTACAIEYPLSGGRVTQEATAFRSPRDQHNKNIGRKVSMHKALLRLFPDKPGVRETFWENYFRMRGGRW